MRGCLGVSDEVTLVMHLLSVQNVLTQCLPLGPHTHSPDPDGAGALCKVHVFL